MFRLTLEVFSGRPQNSPTVDLSGEGHARHSEVSSALVDNDSSDLAIVLANSDESKILVDERSRNIDSFVCVCVCGAGN
jgi:hypothetical protein